MSVKIQASYSYKIRHNKLLSDRFSHLQFDRLLELRTNFVGMQR